MSDSSTEPNEITQKNEWGGYEHLMSEKSQSLLKSNGLTYKLGATRDSIAIGLPFSVAVVPGLIPFAEVCFAASMNADYRYIKQKSLASTISETVKNVLALEGLDDSNTTWWPIYVYDSLEVEGNKVYTADTRLLPVEGAHFAGFAYKLKADSWGGNHEFTGDRVPLSIKQRDFNIKSPRNVSPSQSKFGANQEGKGLIVQSSAFLEKEKALDLANLLERYLDHVQLSVNYGFFNLFIERDGKHVSDKGNIKRTEAAVDEAVNDIVTRLKHQPINKAKADAVRAEVGALISEENQEILSRHNYKLSIKKQKENWFVAQPWEIAGDKKHIPISWMNEHADLTDTNDDDNSIRAVLTSLGRIAGEFYCFPVYSNDNCNDVRYFYTTAKDCCDLKTANFVGFAYIHKSDYEVRDKKTGEVDHSKSLAHEAVLHQSLDDQLSMLSLYKHELIVDISLWRDNKYIGSIPYTEKDAGSVNAAIDTLVEQDCLVRSLML